jgi:fructose-1,6-bisphosphatase/inositol monophosphatase family enzyme
MPRVSSSPDIDAVSAIIRDVAATEIMPRFRRLADDEVWHKQGGSVVTVADEASETRLVRALGTLVPGSVALGEEDAERDPAAFVRLAGESPVWIVDPVDGTANFAAGKPRFAVIVAYAVAGETVAGWIFDPVGDRMATAEQGGGAWQNGTRLRVPGRTRLDEMHGALPGRMRRVETLKSRFAGIHNSGCAGFDYLALADGTLNFAFSRRLKPWDHAAGQLIHAEAGGHSRGLDGTDYRPDRAPGGPEGLLLAPDPRSWRSIAEAIAPVAYETWRR